MLELLSANREYTLELGRRLGKLLEGGEVVALSGPLGVGKTVLIKGLARGLGVDEREVVSPSFALVHEHQGRLPLYHIDLYRLSPEEVALLGLEEYLGQGVCAVEWADRAPGVLPPEHLWVTMEFAQGEVRRLRLLSRGARYRRLLEDLRWD